MNCHSSTCDVSLQYCIKSLPDLTERFPTIKRDKVMQSIVLISAILASNSTNLIKFSFLTQAETQLFMSMQEVNGRQGDCNHKGQ